jgi:hypothetical protein
MFTKLNAKALTILKQCGVIIDIGQCSSNKRTYKNPHPTLLERLKCKFQSENGGRKNSLGTFYSLEHFGGRGVCWSSGMGTRKSDKQVNYSHRLAQTKQQIG